MKKRIALLLSLLVMAAALLPGCSESKTKTLEEVASANQEVAEEINKGVEETGLQMDIKGNAVTYSYDISSIDGVTEELLENDDFIEMFRSSLDSQASSFAETCAALEEKTGIEGITITVIYLYGDKEIVNSTYSSADASDDPAGEESDNTDDPD